ncbi:PH, RCC1 and FYVE domains-containing protein 1 isoform X2 [Selaginella moellendorffii]|uniref:PH, RCC1 and FYVE domains-containing protein 1 isoform X2 n=1 Tax=Selaginella moellendorffii TaxID=88036 RepID=UPI000D1C4F6B|nr:PH, RCC1 and FYVE domains-containing protein 1 isoform X2 [Selaginella moellendorffii]|eukprot:XP_024524184.1 PH, RCC1 and FYVE domains-containing protein 1 isoform X2 [Selaginella moellendorffii]
MCIHACRGFWCSRPWIIRARADCWRPVERQDSSRFGQGRSHGKWQAKFSFFLEEVSLFSSSSFFCKSELYTWGRDEGEGRLGHGNPDIMDEGALSRPTKVQAIDVLIASVYCGGFITMALTKSGQLWSWGGNANHELGHGTRANNWKPKVVAALEDVTLVQVACGGFHAAALTQDGKVITWGYGGNGQLGHGTWKTGKSRLLSRPCIACGPAWTAAITENETRRSSPPCETCPLRKMGSMAALRTILVSTAVCTSSTPGLAWKPVSNPSQSTTTKPSSTGHMMSSGGVCR